MRSITVHTGVFGPILVCNFAVYLQGIQEFTVTTDNNPVPYVLTSAKLDPTDHSCWLADLTNVHFNIVYKPGKHNTDADALSQMTSESVQAVRKSMSEEEWEGYAQCLAISCCSAMLGARKESSHVLKIMRTRSSLKVEDGALCRQIQGKDRVVLPLHFVDNLLNMAHSEMGHQGSDQTMTLCKEQVCWVGMEKDLKEFIDRCDRCKKAKAPSLPEKPPLNSIISKEPLHGLLEFRTIKRWLHFNTCND